MIYIEPLKNNTSDVIYNNITNYYNGFIGEDYDKLFCDLIEVLEDNTTKEEKQKLLPSLLSKISDIEFLSADIPIELIDFKASPELNLRLSIMINKIIKLRQKVYQKAYYIAQNLVEQKDTDSKILEDLKLGIEVILECSIENFYADLTIYLSDEHLDRFYNELDLIDITIAALNGEEISQNTVDNLSYRLNNTHQKEISYLKSRFVNPKLTMKRGNNNDNN